MTFPTPRRSSRLSVASMLLVAVSLLACGRDDEPLAAFEDDDPVVDFSRGQYGGLEPGDAAAEFEGLGPWLNSPRSRSPDSRRKGRSSWWTSGPTPA